MDLLSALMVDKLKTLEKQLSQRHDAYEKRARERGYTEKSIEIDIYHERAIGIMIGVKAIHNLIDDLNS